MSALEDDHYLIPIGPFSPEHQNDEKKVIYRVTLSPLSHEVDDIYQQLPPPVQVKIHFALRKIHQQSGLSSEGNGRTKTLTRIWHRQYATCQFYLTMFKCFDVYFPFLSRELSTLGVEQERHREIVEKILKWAYTAETQIKEADHHKVVLQFNVNLVRHEYVWQCEYCQRKAMLKRHLVYSTTADEAAANRRTATTAAAGEGHKKRFISAICSVCLVEFGPADCAVRTTCCHQFHEECILTWMLKNPSCPICRFKMPI